MWFYWRYINIILWRHQMEIFPRYWPFVCGIHGSPVNSPLKASDAELWCFLWSLPESTIVQTMEVPVIWDAIALIMTSLYWVQLTPRPITLVSHTFSLSNKSFKMVELSRDILTTPWKFVTVIIMQDKRVLVYHREWFKQPLTFQCRETIWNDIN